MWRKLQDDTLWSRSNEPFCRRAAWIDLLLMTWAKEKTFLVNGNPTNLQPGQMIVSYRFLASKWRRSVDWVAKFFKLLIEDEKISRIKVQTGTLVTICNWEIYQQNIDNNKHGIVHETLLGTVQIKEGKRIKNKDGAFSANLKGVVESMESQTVTLEDEKHRVVSAFKTKFGGNPRIYGHVHNMLTGKGQFKGIGGADPNLLIQVIDSMPGDLTDPVGRLTDMVLFPGKYS